MEKPIFIKILDLKLLKWFDRALIKVHIIHRSNKLNKSIPNDIGSKIDEYENMFAPDNLVKFSFIKDGFSVLLNGKATGSNRILLTPEWAARLLLCNDDDTINAFLLTVGHEMTHNEGDFSTKGFHGINKKFINWVNEVHADFGATQKMVYSNKEKLLNSIDYKIAAKEEKKNILLKLLEKTVLVFINETSHPSWKQRKVYAETGVFDKALIETIAINTGCIDNDLINDVVNYYQEIILND